MVSKSFLSIEHLHLLLFVWGIHNLTLEASAAAANDESTTEQSETLTNCKAEERAEFMRCRMRFEASGLSNRSEMRKQYCSIITEILKTCFKSFEQCASAEEIQTSRDRFLIKEYLSASLYSDLFPTLLTCSPTMELLASNRYGSIEKQGSGIGCSGFASFNTQMECVKQIVPKMVDEQRKVPMRRNSRFAAADPDKLQEFRDLLCVAASNITSGRCGDKSGKMSSLLDISRCWGQGAKAAEDGVDPKMQDFFSQTLIYNLNRLITQREPADAAAAGTVQPVEPLSHECLQHPADGAPDVLTQPLFQTNTTSSSSTTSTISIAICIISSSLTFILS